MDHGIPVTGVSELVLEVQDLDASIRFYTEDLGLPLVERWDRRQAAWIMAGDRTRIGLWTPQVGLAGGRGGSHVHYAMHLDDAHFDAAVQRLRARDLKVEIVQFGNHSKAAYVDDPDGNVVELWTWDVAAHLRGEGT